MHVHCLSCFVCGSQNKQRLFQAFVRVVSSSDVFHMTLLFFLIWHHSDKFFPPNRGHRFVTTTHTLCLCRRDSLLKCYLQNFNASGSSCDRPKLSGFSVVFPSLQHMLSRYRTPVCGPPTANIDSSPQCGLQSVVANTPAWQQLSACILRFTPDTPNSIRFTFRIYHRFTFCTTCLYQKDERVLNGELATGLA